MMAGLGTLTLAVALAPAVAIVLILLIRRPRAAEALNLAASAVSLLAILMILASRNESDQTFWGSYVIIDGLGTWTILCAAIVYFLASVYAVGYMRLLDQEDRLYRFYAMFAGFGLSILIGPMMNNAGLYWIAIELTTLVSTFLVAFEREAVSIEAAWKYIIVVSAGISLALLGTVLFYWSGTFVLGPTYDMTWKALQEIAPRLNPAVVSLSFLLVLIGYGTKVGLAPMHTWLPDAHSEGPAPVSALLSGALLNTAMVGIVRYLAVADAAGISTLARGTLLALGYQRSAVLVSLVLESILMGLISGVIGVVISSAMQFASFSAVNFNTFSEVNFRFTLTPGVVAASLLFAAAMGYAGGFLPALRAARMPIVQAVRGA